MKDTTYDNAKGIGLILVILGHLLPFGNLQSSVVYSIHMPLFFYISGIFIRPACGVVKRLIFNYIFPYVFFQFIIGGIIFSVKSFMSNESLGKLISNTLQEIFMFSGSSFTCMDHLWFLVSLTISMVGASCILQCREQINRKAICDISVIVFLSLTAILIDKYSITLPFRLQTVPAIIVLLIIGNKYKDHVNMFVEACSKWQFCTLLVAFVVLSVVNRTVNMSLAVYNNYLLYLLTVFLGITVIIYISKRVRLKSLSYIGRNTLILFAIHGVYVEVYKMSLEYTGISLHDMYSMYCYVGTIVVLACSFISLLALRRIYFYYDSTMRNFLNVEK